MAATLRLPYPSTDTPGLRAHRACRHCVQIKAKCVPLEGSGNSICQRCSRLGKECSTPAPVPRKRQRNKSTRVARLEERLDTLTNLITTGRGHREVSDPPLHSPLPTPPTPPASSTSTYEVPPAISELSAVLGANGSGWAKSLACRQVFSRPYVRVACHAVSLEVYRSEMTDSKPVGFHPERIQTRRQIMFHIRLWHLCWKRSFSAILGQK